MPKKPKTAKYSFRQYFWLHGMVWVSQQYCLFPHTATKPPSVVTETSTPVYLLHPSNGSTIGSVEDERTPLYNKYRHR